MAILTSDQMLEKIKGIIGDNNSDETLTFLEDVQETVNSFADNDNWKVKYEQNDAEWRQRYRDRFFEGSPAPAEEDKIDDKSDITIEQLFT